MEDVACTAACCFNCSDCALDKGEYIFDTHLYCWTKTRIGEFLPCVLPLRPRRQASLLRSHAGGFSLVSATECMLYAASEVSAIHGQVIWPMIRAHLICPIPTTQHLFGQTFPPLFLSLPSVIYTVQCNFHKTSLVMKPFLHNMQSDHGNPSSPLLLGAQKFH